MKDKKKDGNEKERKEELSIEAAQQIGELTETLQRLQADFENYKKHTEKEKEKATSRATARFIEELLPLVDTFELAMKSISKEKDTQLVKGVEMIYVQFMALLDKHNVKAINAEGKELDPEKHDVLMREETDEHADGMVIEEMQKGYMMGDYVLRTSKVKIACAPEIKIDNGAKEGEAKENKNDENRKEVNEEADGNNNSPDTTGSN